MATQILQTCMVMAVMIFYIGWETYDHDLPLWFKLGLGGAWWASVIIGFISAFFVIWGK